MVLLTRLCCQHACIDLHHRHSTAQTPGPSSRYKLTAPLSCCAAIISRFEHRVQELNPQMQKVSYALKDLYSWLDNMVRCPHLLAASADASEP